MLVVGVDVVVGVVVDDAVVVGGVVVASATAVVVLGATVVSAVPSPPHAPATSAVATKRSQPPRKRNALPFREW